MAFQCNYILELTFSGPLLSQAPGVLAFGVDTSMQRYRKEPVLNGSLIRGNIRHALTEFAELFSDTGLSDDINRWFGAETSDNTYTPNRAEVDFDFFWKLKQPLNDAGLPTRRTRIKLDENGKAEDGALQVIEDCFPSGEDVNFEGKLSARFASGEEKRAFAHWLSKALDYIPAMGSFKGVGFGKLERWTLTENDLKKAKKQNGHSFLDGNTRIGITLELDRPFCLGRPRTPESNRVVSDEIISGNVIKGIIARHYPPGKLPKDLCFDELIISHAVPIPIDQGHPVTLPLSLAIHKKETVDMALASAGYEWDKAPAFQPDWKPDDYRKVENDWGSSNKKPDRYLSIRTEINRKKGISEESRLFTLECIDPHGFIWCADIELCQIEESKRPAAFARLQTAFQQGLIGIGKTKARAKVTIAHPFTPFKQITKVLLRGSDDLYIITLQTPARLLSPKLKLSGVNSHTALKQRYQEYWDKQHDGITLKGHFAQQQLISAYYHQRQHDKSAVDYNPEWLTTAGSVFILQIQEAAALQLLKGWERTGLPAHPDADGSVATWHTTPHLPEHGYGEIIINDPRQLDLLYQPKVTGEEESQ